MRIWKWLTDTKTLTALGVLIAGAGLVIAVLAYRNDRRDRDPDPIPTPTSAPSVAPDALHILSHRSGDRVDRELFVHGSWSPVEDHHVWVLVSNGRKAYSGGRCGPAGTIENTWRTAELYVGSVNDAGQDRIFDVRALVVDSRDSDLLRNACDASRDHGVVLDDLNLRTVAATKVSVIRR